MRRFGLLVAVLGLVVGGCGTFGGSRPPAVDITGNWTGRWLGYGITSIPREEVAFGEFTQNGYRGRGRLTLEGTPAADSVPVAVRAAGAEGSRVLFEVAGTKVRMIHENGPAHLLAEFQVAGDQMIGHIVPTTTQTTGSIIHRSGYMLDDTTPVRIILVRERPDAMKAAPPTAMPPPPPPPPVAAAPPPGVPAPGAPPSGAPTTPGATEGTPTTPAPEPAQPPAGEQIAQQQAPRVPTPESQAQESRPVPKDFAAVPELKTVLFAFDKADLRPEDAALLDQSAEWLKGNDMLVLIEGHADERGTNEYNLALGERRAKAIRDYLIGKGIAADRINTVSYGEERPICTLKTEDCFTQNRRGDLLAKPR
jgi:peptidoglycan-associated lipoprotein